MELDPTVRSQAAGLLQELLANGDSMVYLGYLDDSLNTDHAWLETSCHHFHCHGTLGALLFKDRRVS
ncbi:MAG: hypothetical protein SGPRY_000472 [Prymnesium sp.]